MKKYNWDWIAVSYLGIEHVLTVIGFISLLFIPFSHLVVFIAIAMGLYFIRTFSITAGYHRLFSHRSYKACALVRFVWAAFGAACVQYPILEWARNHLWHHAYTDTEMDPSNVKNGFWWSQILCWMVKRIPVDLRDRSLAHLVSDPIVLFQKRWYVPLQIFFGLIFPGSIACAALQSVEAFFIGMLSSICSVNFQRHMTGLVNSLAHMKGKKKLRTPDDSGRDNFFVTLVTLGEGQQDTHHQDSQFVFNGIWYDPTGWLILFFEKIRLAKELCRTRQFQRA